MIMYPMLKRRLFSHAHRTTTSPQRSIKVLILASGNDKAHDSQAHIPQSYHSKISRHGLRSWELSLLVTVKATVGSDVTQTGENKRTAQKSAPGIPLVDSFIARKTN